jgi:hypothetical protein
LPVDDVGMDIDVHASTLPAPTISDRCLFGRIDPSPQAVHLRLEFFDDPDKLFLIRLRDRRKEGTFVVERHRRSLIDFLALRGEPAPATSAPDRRRGGATG